MIELKGSVCSITEVASWARHRQGPMSDVSAFHSSISTSGITSSLSGLYRQSFWKSTLNLMTTEGRNPSWSLNYSMRMTMFLFFGCRSKARLARLVMTKMSWLDSGFHGTSKDLVFIHFVSFGDSESALCVGWIVHLWWNMNFWTIRGWSVLVATLS